MSGSGREALTNVRELSGGHLDDREWSVGPLGCPGVNRKHSQMTESGWESIPDVREALSNIH